MAVASVIGILITGGPAMRLRPLTLALPKRCLPIGNVAVQIRMCRWLSAAGVREVRIGTSAQEAPGPLPTAEECGLERIVAVCEPSPVGTAGFLRIATAESDDLLIAANGDVMTSIDPTPLLRTAREKDADLVIAVRRVRDPSQFGLVDFDECSRVRNFSEKSESSGPGFINTGVYALHPRALRDLVEGQAASLERDVVPRLLASGRPVLAYDVGERYWVDVGTRSGYLEANRDCALGRSPFDGVGRHRSGYLAAEDAAIDAESAVLAGSCVASRCVVESGAYVAGSVLLHGSRVETGASVVDSVVGPDTVVPAGTEVRSRILLGAAV